MKLPSVGNLVLPVILMLALAQIVQASDVDPDEIIAAHNLWRRAVGVPPLAYSDDLAETAQSWADELAENHGCRMKHSKSGGQYGENIYWASATLWSDGRREEQDVGSRPVVDAWGKEKRDYDYGRNRCAKGRQCGHYTQLVWRQTTEVGCAVSVCGETLEQVWVCHYKPAGNWAGQKPY